MLNKYLTPIQKEKNESLLHKKTKTKTPQEDKEDEVETKEGEDKDEEKKKEKAPVKKVLLQSY